MKDREGPEGRRRAVLSFDEIEKAAAGEKSPAVAGRLRQIASALRDRRPAAPEGISVDIHGLLLSRVADIESHARNGLP